MDLQGRPGMDRRLGDARCGATAGSRGRSFGLPDVRTGEVGVGRCRGVEDDGGDNAGLPLRLEQRLELATRPLGVVPGPANRDEG